MAVGLIIAFVLDNTMPGTKEERGLQHWNLKGGHENMSEEARWSYDLPFGLSPLVRSCNAPNCCAISLTRGSYTIGMLDFVPCESVTYGGSRKDAPVESSVYTCSLSTLS